MTRRFSQRTGKTYTVGSTSGFGDWPGDRTCPICGKKVLVKDSAVMHTDVASGAMTATHLACKHHVSAPATASSAGSGKDVL